MKKLLISYLLLGIILSTLLINHSFGSLGPLHFLALLVFLCILILATKKDLFYIFNLNKLSKLIILFGIIVTISYFFNLKYYYYISNQYYLNIGENPPYLYLKIVICGFLYIFVVFTTYQIGRAVFDKISVINTILYCIIFCSAINAIVDIYNWIDVTGGEIGRYNFKNTLAGSPGSSIQLGIIGFFISLSFLKSFHARFIKIFFLFLMIIFIFQILIIITRQAQLRFLLILLLYYLISSNLKFKILNLFYLLLLTLSLLIVLDVEVPRIYQDLFSSESVDISARLTAINSAWNIFLDNLILGVGYGMYAGHNTDPISIGSELVYVTSVHNGFFSFLSELGIIGFLFQMYFVYYVLLNINSIKKRLKNPENIKLCTIIFSMQIVLSVELLVGNFHFFGPPSEYHYLCFSFIYFIFLAICGNLVYIEKLSNYRKSF